MHAHCPMYDKQLGEVRLQLLAQMEKEKAIVEKMNLLAIAKDKQLDDFRERLRLALDDKFKLGNLYEDMVKVGFM